MSTESHLPIDKSVILPAAVRAAGAAADAMMAAAIAPPAGGPPPPTGGPPPPAGFSQHAQPTPPQPPLPPQATPAPAQPNGDPPPAEPGTVEGQWQRRAMSWRGQIEADRAAHQREIAGLRIEMENLRAQLTSGGTPPASGAAPAPVQLALDPAKRAKLVETWGEEMVEAMEGVGRDMASAAMGQVTHRVQEDLGATRQEMWQRDNVAMMSALDQMLPQQGDQAGWRIINNDPDFQNWLQQQDGFSRLTRHQVLLDAWNRNDTQAVYQMFAAYMGQPPQGGNGPGTVPPAPHPNGAPQPSNRLPMHQFAAPGPARSAGHGAPVAPDVNQYTQSHIAWFFSQKARGVFNDTPQRQQWAAAIEADIFAAQREGRVVPG